MLEIFKKRVTRRFTVAVSGSQILQLHSTTKKLKKNQRLSRSTNNHF